jgi:hypothetical protein
MLPNEVFESLHPSVRANPSDGPPLETAKIFLRARELANIEVDEYYNGAISKTTVSGKIPILNSGYSPGNFVYGEVSFDSFLSILERWTRSSDQTFVDCGCGAGVTLAACGLFSGSSRHGQNFSRIIGIDLMSSKVLECRTMVRILAELDSLYTKWLDIEVLESDFLSVDWSCADIVYSCATCFSDHMFSLLVAKLSSLKCGSRVLLMDKEIEYSSNTPITFQLLASTPCQTTWGTGTMHIYEKKY